MPLAKLSIIIGAGLTYYHFHKFFDPNDRDCFPPKEGNDPSMTKIPELSASHDPLKYFIVVQLRKAIRPCSFGNQVEERSTIVTSTCSDKMSCSEEPRAMLE